MLTLSAEERLPTCQRSHHPFLQPLTTPPRQYQEMDHLSIYESTFAHRQYSRIIEYFEIELQSRLDQDIDGTEFGNAMGWNACSSLYAQAKRVDDFASRTACAALFRLADWCFQNAPLVQDTVCPQRLNCEDRRGDDRSVADWLAVRGVRILEGLWYHLVDDVRDEQCELAACAAWWWSTYSWKREVDSLRVGGSRDREASWAAETDRALQVASAARDTASCFASGVALLAEGVANLHEIVRRVLQMKPAWRTHVHFRDGVRRSEYEYSAMPPNSDFDPTTGLEVLEQRTDWAATQLALFRKEGLHNVRPYTR